HAGADNVRVVRLRRNFGKAAALVAGFDQARGETIVTLDGDLQDDPSEIPRLLAKLEEGFDLVSGWKTHRRDPLVRRLLSRLFNAVTSRFSGVRLHDMNCGLKAYRAEVVRGLRIYGELHRFIPVLAHYRGYRIAELPVNHRPREHGRSRYGPERYLRGFLDLLTVSFIGRYRHRPLHLFGGLGLALGAIGLGILVYLTVLKLGGHAIGGGRAPPPPAAPPLPRRPARRAGTTGGLQRARLAPRDAHRGPAPVRARLPRGARAPRTRPRRAPRRRPRRRRHAGERAVPRRARRATACAGRGLPRRC